MFVNQTQDASAITPKSQTPGASAGRRKRTDRCALRERKVARRLLAALGDDLVVDLLAFHQRAHAGALDCADMHEHVLRAVGRLNESEALLGIEELHSTCRHHGSPCLIRLLIRRTRLARRTK